MNIITLDDFCSGHGLTGQSASTGPAVGRCMGLYADVLGSNLVVDNFFFEKNLALGFSRGFWVKGVGLESIGGPL